jgi:nucleoside-diphosphate-sugar epimerase/predicted dehydrogenase
LNAGEGTTGPAIRAAIVGTGFIADFHARGIENSPGVELVAVCDANIGAAEAFGAARGVKAYRSVAEMFAQERIDAVHVLTPPDSHHPVAKQCLEAGAHVFVEKPLCVSVAEIDDLMAVAGPRGLVIGVNHSMTYIPGYDVLRAHVLNRDLGPIDQITINHLSELGIIRFGPFTNWIVREPQNALLEIGPHVVSELVDLVGVPDRIEAVADRDVELPGGGRAYRRWRIRAEVGRTAADINLDFGPGFAQRTIAVRGLLGAAHLDFNANTCTVDRATASGLDFDRYRRTLAQARELRAQARSTLAATLKAKVKRPGAGTPDQLSIQAASAAFYRGIREPAAMDARITAERGRQVIAICEEIIARAGLRAGARPTGAPAAAARGDADVVVFGGGGFIGKRLVVKLLEAGHRVRVAGRGGSPALAALGHERLEIMRADLRSPADLERALGGAETVFHLATSDAKTWPQYLEREVEPSRRLAEAALARGVRRFVYTGTIDSYYAGAGAGTITEDTPLDPRIERRNYYARAKAAAERLLTGLHAERGLPLVIARPGIVIGKGGNPFHWGVGKWASEGVVQVWGDGTNPLPLVLVDDVADGLVRCMDTPGIEGRSFNLIDLPLLSARDYLDALQRLADIRIQIDYTPIWRFWLDDLSKWPVKKAVRHPDGSRRPSYHDWESRTQKAVFDCTRTREALRWSPASDRQRIVEEGIGGSLEAWLNARL